MGYKVNNKRLQGITLAALFLYSFAITVSFLFPPEPRFIAAQMAARTAVYLSGLMLGMACGMYFIGFYKISESGKRRLRIGMLAVYALLALLVLTNPKTHLIFYFQPDGGMVYPKTYLIVNMFSRSNSASAPNTVSMNLPCGVVVSMFSFRLTNSTPFSVSSETMESKSRVFRAILEML